MQHTWNAGFVPTVETERQTLIKRTWCAQHQRLVFELVLVIFGVAGVVTMIAVFFVK